MPSPKIFAKHGLDRESIQKYWTAKGDNPKRDRLKQLIAGRSYDGMESGLRDHAIWWAIDLAYDAPFNQITPTIVRDVISKTSGKSAKDVIEVLNSWKINLKDIVRTVKGADGQELQTLNEPFLNEVVVPLVKSYVTIRRAKLYNDRNIFPLFKYEPIKFTLENRLIGEIVTDLVQQISQQFGYPAVLRQAILQALQYGTCLMFPMEEWYCDNQIGDDGKDKCLREGLRYHMPHPTRFYWDKAHRISTINTDSGCEYMGYWQVERWATISDNDLFFNKDKVGYGKGINVSGSYPRYFSEVFPCQMNFPQTSRGAGEADREKDAEFYSSTDDDKAVFVNTSFHKIVPKKYGLGTYPHPVWMRFVVGGDNTVMWNAPVAYCPAIYMGYDADELRSRTAPMSLEVLPFQDLFGMTFAQYIYSTRQNLTKAILFDSDQIEQSHIDQIDLMGNARYAKVPFIPFSGRKTKVHGQEQDKAFHNIQFPIQDTSGLAQLQIHILSVLERVLVLSAQEIGQAATHEQTAEETRIIATNTSTRVTFTGSYIDDGIDAWKRQLYNAARAHMDDDIVSQVSLSVDGSKKVLEKLGFEVDDDSGSENNGRIKARISGKLSSLTMDSFISTREGEARINGAAIAGAMSNLLQVAFSNPVTAQAIGPEQSLQLITEIGKLAGMPKEWELKPMKGSSPEEQQKQAIEGLAQIQEQIVAQSVKATEQAIGEPLAEQLGQTNQAVQAVNQKVDESNQAIQILIQKLEPLIQAMEQPQMAPPQPDPVNDISYQEPALV